jgi:addiction module HigA family antidote
MWTIIERNYVMKNHPHPGEILREDVIVPLGLDVTEAARRLSLSRPAFSRVLNGRAGISPDLAVRLEQAGVGTARAWMQLQANYELSLALARPQPPVIALGAA